MAKTVRVTLRRSLGLRNKGGVAARHYGPGEVDMPVEDARLLGIVDEDGAISKEFKAQQKLWDKQKKFAGAAAPPASEEEEDEEEDEDVDATPSAIKLAEDNEVDIADVVGTGKNGRVLEKDVQAYLDEVADEEDGA